MAKIQVYEDSPLGKDALDMLNECLRSCASTREKIERAKRAGLPTEQAESENAQTYNLAAAIKREFFPGAP